MVEKGGEKLKSIERKEELLKIAYNKFITKGYQNTSIDEIINEAKIAKGTYYYYFESKEKTLEEVINMVVEKMTNKAKKTLELELPLEQKFINIILSFKPEINEETLTEAINLPENIIMHEKINKKIIKNAVPILSQIVEEGNKQGILNCKENIPEKIKITLMLSSDLFDEGNYNENDIEIYIDIVETLLGAKKESLSFIKKLIGNGEK